MVGVLEKVVTKLKTERDAAQVELDAIYEKYSGGGFYSKEDSSNEDYLESKVQWLDYAIYLMEGEDNA